MSWTLLVGLVVVTGVALCACLVRRGELRRMRRNLTEREDAVRTGAAEARLMHPVVDLSRCLGCGACVAACPEDQVLELVHGQARVVNGVRCEHAPRRVGGRNRRYGAGFALVNTRGRRPGGARPKPRSAHSMSAWRSATT